MIAYKRKLSGSTDGRGIKIAATATPGTLIHTGSSLSQEIDEVWLWVVNSDTVARKVTLEFGGVSAPDDLIEQVIGPEDGLFLLTPGLVLAGNSTPLNIRAFCATANVCMIHGYINRVVNA